MHCSFVAVVSLLASAVVEEEETQTLWRLGDLFLVMVVCKVPVDVIDQGGC